MERVKGFCWAVIMANMVVGMWMNYGPGYEGFHWTLVEGRMCFAWACLLTVGTIWAYERLRESR